MQLMLRQPYENSSWLDTPEQGELLISQIKKPSARIELEIWQCSGIPVDTLQIHTQLASIPENFSRLLDVALPLTKAVWGSSLCLVTDKMTGERLFLPDVGHTIRLYFQRTNEGVILDTNLINLVRGKELQWNRSFLLKFAATQFGIRGETPFAGIHIVPPGCAIVVSQSGDITIEKVWPLKQENKAVSASQAIDRVYAHLAKTVPEFSLALSGGVDSSASGIFIRHALKADTPLRGIHFYTSLSPDYNEKAFAEKIASSINAELIPIDIERSLPFTEINSETPPAVLNQELLYLATHRVIQTELSNDVTILEGEGGDLLFHAAPDIDVVNDAFHAGGIQEALQTTLKLARLHNGSIPRILTQAMFHQLRIYFGLSEKRVQMGIADEIFCRHAVQSLLAEQNNKPHKNFFSRSVSALDSFLEVMCPTGSYGIRRINPFLAPPIVEAALALNPHDSFSEYNDRFILRDLASQICNIDVLWRRTKGSFNAGILRGLQVNQEQYLSLVENGVLASAGLISPIQIRDALHKVLIGQSSAGITLALIGCVEIYCASWKNYLARKAL